MASVCFCGYFLGGYPPCAQRDFVQGLIVRCATHPAFTAYPNEGIVYTLDNRHNNGLDISSITDEGENLSINIYTLSATMDDEGNLSIYVAIGL